MELDIYMATLWLQILVEQSTITYHLMPSCDRFVRYTTNKLNTVDMDRFRIIKSYYGCFETRQENSFIQAYISVHSEYRLTATRTERNLA
jgi:hypothetical protein